MIDVCVEAFNIQTFNQDGNESAISKINFYNPPILIFKQRPVKEKVGNVDINRIRNGYFFDGLTSAEIQETVKFEGKEMKTFDGVI